MTAEYPDQPREKAMFGRLYLSSLSQGWYIFQIGGDPFQGLLRCQLVLQNYWFCRMRNFPSYKALKWLAAEIAEVIFALPQVVIHLFWWQAKPQTSRRGSISDSVCTAVYHCMRVCCRVGITLYSGEQVQRDHLGSECTALAALIPTVPTSSDDWKKLGWSCFNLFKILGNMIFTSWKRCFRAIRTSPVVHCLTVFRIVWFSLVYRTWVYCEKLRLSRQEP